MRAKQQVHLLASFLRWGRLVPYMRGRKAGLCLGVRTEEQIRCLAHPSNDIVQCPAFAPGSSEVAIEFFWGFFGTIWSIISPNCACKQLFLAPCNFFIFCSWRRRLSRCKRCSKASQVPACLSWIRSLLKCWLLLFTPKVHTQASLVSTLL